MFKKILPVSLFLFTFCFSIAQQVKNKNAVSAYRAIHWTTQDGLSNDNANIMIKDSKGFLWIGSQNAALCRFDGARFKKFIPDPHKRGSINATGIFGFTEDSLKNIWIGTDKGLSRYDLKADTFTNFTPVVDSAALVNPLFRFGLQAAMCIVWNPVRRSCHTTFILLSEKNWCRHKRKQSMYVPGI